ncbi:hypothetical protein CBW24_12980 [Pacificitalea manganoxidans]|uniref:DUF3775 domain-containing protein n=1 Tax=Pacificitalea manganoxidans TaxID=1411902 RepID=A0A291M1L8_9RHOB|nr:DUF3775 domain-containing protein [Pacificitalea manganoxidans]MAQ46767.1 DUF3775 domain-containing protein [Actibacterium sp.]OWU68802.1 hypothetical protein ATO2_10105 [Roseovarius sp. 22II1-1F6A]ATI42822.1 hypothetical protein CBW24_12980 [Pacificitalea manganoxidans]MBF53410.1 DUF3775 domain-containing protein [Actibacterium sp.]MDR6307269.1 hypothetical protein [Pacificitalea manganoxidans]|tara:strand:- start:53 stop:373 length:321 start_codon:yes stop_codon:yes gene_type:complete
MLEISSGKVVRVIALAREFGSDNRQLRNYVSSLNEDEQISLVALTWIGRESFEADEAADAMHTARQEMTLPTDGYLARIPNLADYLEDGMEALGIGVADAEDHLRD